jgi:hypothetical protein
VSKKPKRRRPVRKRTRGSTSVPCPTCGSPSRVLRTTLGERLRTSRRRRDFVVRERRCASPAHHRFQTEERSR